jgi:hypothetical protein
MNFLANEAAKVAARRSPRRRFAVAALSGLYCLAIFLALDFLYSHLFYHPAGSARIADPVFSHTLRPNFDGYALWGERKYRLITDSLGFKDAAVRQITLTPDTRRVILIGDSFTEGLGVPFEESFAGMLAAAGAQRAAKTEFLDAGVLSYSPTLYYRKIKFLIDSGLVFDDVVVLPDLSDVIDEATSYFCFDDEPQYRALCPSAGAKPQPRSDGRPSSPAAPPNPIAAAMAERVVPQNSALKDATRVVGGFLQRNFTVTDALRLIVKFKLQDFSGEFKREQFVPSERIGWSVPSYDVGNAYAPLGVEGGMARALLHMRGLADLLAQRHIPLTVAVYPWPLSLVQADPTGRWVPMWRQFCAAAGCKAFVDTFPDFIAVRDAHADWYERYFILGDAHFSAAGHRIVFDALTRAGL